MTSVPFGQVSSRSLRETLKHLLTPLARERLLPQTLAHVSILCLFALCLGCGGGGPVTSTTNPQVALYTLTASSAGQMTVEFGQTTSYGFKTSPQAIPSGGGTVGVYVAGMLPKTTYHMRALVKYDNGHSFTDADHTFTTGSYPANLMPQITATTSPGQTPQPGIEMLNPANSNMAQVVATDLSGNVLWAYLPPDALGNGSLQSVKQLSNGDYITVISTGSSIEIKPPLPVAPDGAPDADLVREFDLVGNTVKQITMAQLNTRLAAANYHLTLLNFHHDVTVLPNGHWLVITNAFKNVVLTGQTAPTRVLGDVIVDLDTNLKPVWVWNEFDHLDVNRHPMQFPDWTHTNAIIYSKDDGNIVVSIRHQNWVVKVDYNNGAGTGAVLWRLGEGGDFKLLGGTDPTDWNFAQHGPSFTTTNTAGIFGLVLMDNGDDRTFPDGSLCGTGNAPPCYTTVPVFQISEPAKTATLEFHKIVPTALFAVWGGNAERLANGHIEYDLCGVLSSSQVFEVANEKTPQTVWNMKLKSNNFYRAFRLPSLYPGVQW